MARSWIVVEGLRPIIGKFADPFISVADGLPKSKSLENAEEALGKALDLFNADVPELNSLQKLLSDAKDSRWLTSYSALETSTTSSDRKLGWPNFLPEDASQSWKKGSLSATISPSLGVQFIVDSAGDKDEDDAGEGASGSLKIHGAFGIAGSASTDLKPVTGAQLGVSGDAERSSEIEYRVKFNDSNRSALSNVLRAASLLQHSPDRLDHVHAAFDDTGSGARLHKIILRRKFGIGASADLTIPVTLNAGKISIKANARVRSAKDQNVEITKTEDGRIQWVLKGNDVYSRRGEVGLTAELGFSLIDKVNVVKLAGVVGKLGNVIETLDDVLKQFYGDVSEVASLLKPGSLVADKIKDAISEKIDGEDLSQVVANALGVSEDDASEALASLVIDKIDDATGASDIFGADSVSGAKAKLISRFKDDILEPSLFGPIDSAIEAAYTGIKTALDKLAENIPQPVAELVQDTLDTTDKLRKYLKTARETLNKIMLPLSNELSLDVSISINAWRERSVTEIAIGRMTFPADPSNEYKKLFAELVCHPTKTLSDLVDSDDPPEGLEFNLSRERQIKTGNSFNLKISTFFSMSAEAITLSKLKVTRNERGITISQSTTATAATTTMGNTRRLEFSQLSWYKDQDYRALSLEHIVGPETGLKFRLVHEDARNLTKADASSFVGSLKNINAISSAQARHCLQGHSSILQLLADRPDNPGQIAIDFDLRGSQFHRFSKKLFVKRNMIREVVEDCFARYATGLEYDLKSFSQLAPEVGTVKNSAEAKRAFGRLSYTLLDDIQDSFGSQIKNRSVIQSVRNHFETSEALINFFEIIADAAQGTKLTNVEIEELNEDAQRIAESLRPLFGFDWEFWRKSRETNWLSRPVAVFLTIVYTLMRECSFETPPSILSLEMEGDPDKVRNFVWNA